MCEEWLETGRLTHTALQRCMPGAHWPCMVLPFGSMEIASIVGLQVAFVPTNANTCWALLRVRKKPRSHAAAMCISRYSMPHYALLAACLCVALAAAYPQGQCVADCSAQRPFKDAFALPGQECDQHTSCGAQVYAGR